jgi:transposase, IS5 family
MQQASLGLDLSVKKTRKRVFLEQMERVVPWGELVALIEPHGPRAKTGRPPFPVQTMLRIHFMQQWFGLSDPAMEEALFDVPLYRQFAQLPEGPVRLPDESTILRFRHLLEQHGLAAQMFARVSAQLIERGLILKTGTLVDATLIDAPSSTKNSRGERDPEMHQTKKGKNWYFGMKTHIGVDAASGLTHHVHSIAANVHDLHGVAHLLHGSEQAVYADAGYQGVDKRDEHQRRAVQWHVAMRPGKRKQLDPADPVQGLTERIEQLKAKIRARVEHPFRVLKQQFGYTKTRYRGLAKNNAQITTLFMLANLWMVRKTLVQSP